MRAPRPMQPNVPILMYHKIARIDRGSKVPGHYVSPGLFQRQMALLKLLGYQSVPLSSLFRDPLPKRPIVLTFDDGYQNFLTNALPSMLSQGFAGTVFLVAHHIGGTNTWDSDAEIAGERLLNLDEIAAARSGGTEFGSHTLDHVNLAQVSLDEAWRQIADSRCELEELLAVPVTTFCYPYGAKTPEIGKMVERAGYRLACSTSRGLNRSDTDHFALKRINIRSDTVLPVFAMKLWRDLRNAR